MNKPRFQLLRVSLRTVLVVVTVSAISLTVYLRYAKQHETAKQFVERNAEIGYHKPWVPESWFGGFFRSVKTVQLSHRRVGNDELLLLQDLPDLQNLYLPRTQITDQGLQTVGKMHKLRRLSLWGNRLTNQGVKHLQGLQRLEVLDVHMTQLDESVLDVITELRNLDELIFDFPVTDTGLEKLARLPSAVPVRLLRCNGISDAGLVHLSLLDGSRLTGVELVEAEISGEGLGQLRFRQPIPPKAERRLHLIECPIDDAEFIRLDPYQFNAFSIVDTPVTLEPFAEYHPEQIRTMIVLPQMTSVSPRRAGDGYPSWGPRFAVVEQPASEISGSTLEKLEYLESVDLNAPASNRKFVSHIKNHSALRELFVHCNDVDPKTSFLPALADLTQLTHLRLANTSRRRTTSTLDLSYLARLRNLNVLEIMNLHIKEEQLQHLAGHTELRSLIISEPSTLGEGMRHLAGLDKLNLLSINGLTNEGAKHVAKLPGLVTLYLINSRVDDDGLRQLESAPMLLYVNIQGPRNSTAKGLQQLRRRLAAQRGAQN